MIMSSVEVNLIPAMQSCSSRGKPSSIPRVRYNRPISSIIGPPHIDLSRGLDLLVPLALPPSKLHNPALSVSDLRLRSQEPPDVEAAERAGVVRHAFFFGL
jgi:hypothetical protein